MGQLIPQEVRSALADVDTTIVTPVASILARVTEVLHLPVTSVLEVQPATAVVDLGLARLDVGRGLAAELLADPYTDESLNYFRCVFKIST